MDINRWLSLVVITGGCHWWLSLVVAASDTTRYSAPLICEAGTWAAFAVRSAASQNDHILSQKPEPSVFGVYDSEGLSIK